MTSRLPMIQPLPVPWIHLDTVLTSFVPAMLACPPSLEQTKLLFYLRPFALAVLDAWNASSSPIFSASSFLLFGPQLKCHFFHCLKFPCLFICFMFRVCLPKRMSAPWDVSSLSCLSSASEQCLAHRRESPSRCIIQKKKKSLILDQNSGGARFSLKIKLSK